MRKLAIVGLGHLGGALLEGLLRAGIAPGDITVCESPARAAALRGTTDAAVTDSINDAIASADVVFLAVKGQAFDALAPEVDRAGLTGKTVVSFMAGVPFEHIYDKLGPVSLVRGMPSLAIAACDGIIGHTAAPPELAALFGKLGHAFEVPPEDIERVTAFSGCGPGFAAYLLDAFVKAGESMGFSAREALYITERTFRAALARGDYAETVRAVATPGGATEQGVLHMDAAGLPEAIAGAMRRAYEKMV